MYLYQETIRNKKMLFHKNVDNVLPNLVHKFNRDVHGIPTDAVLVTFFHPHNCSNLFEIKWFGLKNINVA